jgi:flagellar biosynthesis/type III secretory pathway M-ring protein FliF/YscJ
VILNASSIDDYVDEVKNLIATAIGADVSNITVEMLPFTGAEAQQEQSAAEAAQALEFEQQVASSAQSAQTLRLIIVVIAVLAVIIFLFAIIKMLRPNQTEMAVEGGMDIIIDDDTPPKDTAATNREIEINSTDSNLSVLEDYIAKNPESAANLLRNWLNEE